MNRNPALCRSFVRQAKEALSGCPQLNHEWSIDDDEDHCILDIPEQCEGGFSITVEAGPDKIILMAGGAHTEFSLEGGPDALAARALGLVRDLLSPAMRIHEYLAGGKPHRWDFEIHDDGKWTLEESVGLFFFRWFGYRAEKFYQNKILPAREKPTAE